MGNINKEKEEIPDLTVTPEEQKEIGKTINSIKEKTENPNDIPTSLQPVDLDDLNPVKSSEEVGEKKTITIN